MNSKDVQPILVAIKCLTYNHAPYIRQCLDGFVMQKTDFRFVAIVHDDASTDGTADIIREYEKKYPEIIKPIYETENQYSKKDGSLFFLVDTAIKDTKCKYIALCEGDDYWTDPLKLCTQIEYLENNPCCGLCYTKVNRFDEKTHTYNNSWGGPNDCFAQFIKENTVPTLTAIFRSKLYYAYINDVQPYTRGWRMGDYPLWIWLSYTSEIKFVDCVTGVYRILETSASHSNDLQKRINFVSSGHDIQRFFLNLFNVEYDVDEFESTKLEQLASFALYDNNSIIAKEYLDKAVILSWKGKLKRVISSSPILMKIFVYIKSRTCKIL